MMRIPLILAKTVAVALQQETLINVVDEQGQLVESGESVHCEFYSDSL